jgi:hypothetical protein
MKERLALLFILLALPLLVSAATFTRPLIIGSKGSDVSALQQILKSEGYLSGNVTGYFGSLTAAAPPRSGALWRRQVVRVSAVLRPCLRKPTGIAA